MGDNTIPNLPFVVGAENRSGTVEKDARALNCYFEKDPRGGVHVVKRPGLTLGNQYPAGVGRGMYFDGTYLYTIIGRTLFVGGVSVGGLIVDDPLPRNGTYVFTGANGNGVPLAFAAGESVYYLTASGAGPTVSGGRSTLDAGAAVTTGPRGVQYLDGTYYIPRSTSGGAFVIGSTALNDPDDFSSLSSILAYIDPADGMYLGKQGSYLLYFKKYSIEMFYDAGSSPGSPLATYPGSKIDFGCANAASIQKLNEVYFYLSQTRQGQFAVHAVSSLQDSPVSTPAVNRLLQHAQLATAATGTIYSWAANCDGHAYYCVTFPLANLSLVYDTASGLWSQWTDADGNYFPYVAAATDANGNAVLLHESNGQAVYLDPYSYTDLETSISVEIVTPLWDNSNDKKKVIPKIGFQADQVPGSFLDVRCTDDDYQSWSNWRQVDLSQKRPILTGNGTTRARAYHLRHQSPTPFRLRQVQLHVQEGTL